MSQAEYEEWVLCGRLPRKANRKVDLYVIDRAMQAEGDGARRVALLKRLTEERSR